jgi:hypothetical protein
MNQTGWNPPILQFIQVKILLLKMVARWNPVFFLKHWFHILHFTNSTGLFTKPTGRHYTNTGSPRTLGHGRTKFVMKGSHHLSQSWNATSSTKWLWAKKLQYWCWIVQREAGKCHIARVQVPWPLSYDLWAPTTTRRLCGLTLLDHIGPSPYVC